ncbi:MAG TPA: hypothetical protein VD794_10550 [Flavisolibacter sp.]|nr:hypothetical protein [Flavisolibacter sp.]
MSEEKFWQWFKNHQSEYLQLDYLDDLKKEALLDKFLKQLHEYCDKLYFEIGGDPLKKERELIITAEGNTKYFDMVERLVDNAPGLSDWKVVAFKQPMGSSFVTEYEGIILDPKKMWFLPLNNEKKPQLIGLRICIDNYDRNNADTIKEGVCQVLDTILGEKATSTEIDYLDVDDLSKYNIDKDGLIELIDLPEYINWKKQKAAH